MSSNPLVLVLWSIALLSERSRLLTVVNAEATQLPDCATTTDGGRCDRIRDHEGCLTRVREVSCHALRLVPAPCGVYIVIFRPTKCILDLHVRARQSFSMRLLAILAGGVYAI